MAKKPEIPNPFTSFGNPDDGTPVEQQASTPVSQPNRKPVKQEARKSVKATYYISPEHDMKLERIRLARRERGVNVDKSALVREAIDLLVEEQKPR